jgi:hypothetical protein
MAKMDITPFFVFVGMRLNAATPHLWLVRRRILWSPGFAQGTAS